MWVKRVKFKKLLPNSIIYPNYDALINFHKEKKEKVVIVFLKCQTVNVANVFSETLKEK